MRQGRPPVSSTTRVFGHFAHSVGQWPHPLAPIMNALLDQRGLDAMWVPLQVSPEHFTATVAGLRHLRDFAGFTVTMPHKVAAARLCDVLLPNAQACGAVNVVRIDPDRRMIGENFDGVAMVQAIKAHRAIGPATRVLLVGAGGAGQAIAVALAVEGVGALAITNRTQARADELVQKVRRVAPACPFEVSRVSETALVAEVVVVPEYTPLLHAAQARGLDIVRGIEMVTPQIEIAADFLGMTAPASAASEVHRPHDPAAASGARSR
jgi:shikimate dehydrogenase